MFALWCVLDFFRRFSASSNSRAYALQTSFKMVISELGLCHALPCSAISRSKVGGRLASNCFEGTRIAQNWRGGVATISSLQGHANAVGQQRDFWISKIMMSDDIEWHIWWYAIGWSWYCVLLCILFMCFNGTVFCYFSGKPSALCAIPASFPLAARWPSLDFLQFHVIRHLGPRSIWGLLWSWSLEDEASSFHMLYQPIIWPSRTDSVKAKWGQVHWIW